MVKNSPLLEQFEKDELRKPHPGYHAQLKIYEAMYEEARELGIFPLKNPLEGVDDDIQLAKALNVLANH